MLKDHSKEMHAKVRLAPCWQAITKQDPEPDTCFLKKVSTKLPFIRKDQKAVLDLLNASLYGVQI